MVGVDEDVAPKRRTARVHRSDVVRRGPLCECAADRVARIGDSGDEGVERGPGDASGCSELERGAVRDRACRASSTVSA